MCMTGKLMKQSLFKSLKHEIVDKLKAKMDYWSRYDHHEEESSGQWVSTTLNHDQVQFQEVNAMSDSDQPYDVIQRLDTTVAVEARYDKKYDSMA